MSFKPRILVVENGPVLSQLISRTLQLMGTDPGCVVSTNEVGVRIQSEKYDAVFIDLDNLQLDPEALTRLIRGSKSNSKIPIAILSGRAEVAQIAGGFGAGATFFLAKPFGTAELGRLLNAIRGMMLEERQRYQRLPLSVPVLCKWAQKSGYRRATGQTTNISSSGLLMKLSPHPETGAVVSAELKLPGAVTPLRLKGLVVRSGPIEQVAVQFVRLGEAERKLIETFLMVHPGSSLFPDK